MISCLLLNSQPKRILPAWVAWYCITTKRKTLMHLAGQGFSPLLHTLKVISYGKKWVKSWYLLWFYNYVLAHDSNHLNYHKQGCSGCSLCNCDKIANQNNVREERCLMVSEDLVHCHWALCTLAEHQGCGSMCLRRRALHFLVNRKERTGTRNWLTFLVLKPNLLKILELPRIVPLVWNKVCNA